MCQVPGFPCTTCSRWGTTMKKAIISLALLTIFVAPALRAATPADLAENAPERYTVVEGDTLWNIAGRFLKQPWRWTELWKINQAQIKNPNRIYPGDVLVLDRSQQEAELRVLRLETVRVEPKVRVEPLEKNAVPGISPTVIEPFLSKPLVVGATELDSAARIVGTIENRVTLGAGDVAYVRGLSKERGSVWQLFRRGDALIDPETKQSLGYTAIYLGEARVREFGDISTIEITRSTQEIYKEDRLIPAGNQAPTFEYLPHAPQKPVRGHIVAAYGTLGEAGPLSIVTLSKGSRDGLEVGHVLAVYRNPKALSENYRTSPVLGRTGPTGSDASRPHIGDELTSRDAAVYYQPKAEQSADLTGIPLERYGLVMVFRTFDRASFGLVMEASRPVSVSDFITNP